MKTLEAGFSSHIDQVVTTLCWCWKLSRKDETVPRGFTDHDVDVAFGGVTFEAASGFTASQIETALGFSIDNLDVSGALSSDDLTETDLSSGLYDEAEIEVWRVNWASTDQRVLIHKGTLGEVKRGKTAFQAEIRGLMQQLAAPIGRAYNYTCDADVGDTRCKIDITNPAYAGTGTVASVIDNRRVTVSGLTAFENQFFTSGKLSWTSGLNAGRSMEIKRHASSAGVISIELWQSMSDDIAAGDSFKMTVGCDRAFATCKKKFSNATNFRGYPYMLGTDAALGYANSETDFDGGSRYGN